MASKLPATQDVTLAIPGVQSSLFGSPLELLEVDDAELRRVAALVGHEAGSVLAQVRRMAGLVAWAAWYRMDEKGYREFAGGMATDLGIEVETLRKWRRAVVTRENLPVPGVAGQRAEAAEKGRKTAGQTGGAVRTSATPKPIPAASTEAPAKQSEGGGTGTNQPPAVVDHQLAPSGPSSAGGTGKVATSAPSEPGFADPGSAPPPADPSSGGARATASPPRRDAPTEVPPTSRPAPPDPSSAGGKALGEVSPTPVRPPTDRALTARVFAAMRDIDPTDAGPVTTPEEATFLRQWAQRTLDAWKAKNVPTNGAMPPRRKGNVIATPLARTPSELHLQGRGKRHADDCSCLSCKAPKAVAK